MIRELIINNVRFTNQDIQRFLTHVKVHGECWIWTTKNGTTKRYGKFGWGPDGHGGHLAQMSCHKLSWIIHRGLVPDGLYVLHNCPDGDKSYCVNPDHLYLGTDQDNKDDIKSKKQGAYGKFSGKRTHPESIKRGCEHGCAKLTEESVMEIRNRWSKGGESLSGLGREFGVRYQTIARIVKGETWTHL